jgi:arginine/lysine/ornithine decarboxylase
VCHAHGAPLLVDEAHGAHLGLHPALPCSALQCGADVAIQSTHKQLSALTQAAMLHAKGGRVSRQRISRALQVLQSSSPNYLLMASLDAARAQAADPSAHDECLAAAAWVREQLLQLQAVELLSAEQVAACSSSGAIESSRYRDSSSASFKDEASCNSSSSSSSSRTQSTQGAAQPGMGPIQLDPLRLTLSLQQLGLSGYQAAKELEQQHGIVAELATPTCVVLAMSIGTTRQQAQALVGALQQLCQAQSTSQACLGSSVADQSVMPSSVCTPELFLTPRDAFFASAEAVAAAEAVGRVSAELLCPYPPGVPVAYPGGCRGAQ